MFDEQRHQKLEIWMNEHLLELEDCVVRINHGRQGVRICAWDYIEAGVCVRHHL